MSHRSVIQTLDLHDDYRSCRTDACASQTYGWLSPRVSFSTDFVGGPAGRVSPEKQKKESQSYSTEFEFSVSSFNIFDTVSQGYIVPADELFHKGKLLPGYMIPGSASKDVVAVEHIPLEKAAVGPATIAGYPTPGDLSASPPLGCVLGPSCVRAPKGPKWRELFGALRRVKSDSGRQRIPDESILPAKTCQGRKRFFKHLFGSGQTSEDVTLSTMVSGTSSSTTSAVPGSHGKNLACNPSSSTRVYGPRLSSGVSTVGAVDSKGKARMADPLCPPTAAGRGVELRADLRVKSSDESSDCFSFNPIPGKGVLRPNSSGGMGRSSPARVPFRRIDRGQGASLSRSGSGRVIMRSLDRSSGSGKNYSISLQEQAKALRAREIRRSPDRSGYSATIRVTPVLNVPVCMGPVLRGATKAGKGRLSNFRSLLTFKSNKMPTSLSTPIATR